MKEHQYEVNSWQGITDAIKAHFGWQVLTEVQSQQIMRMYIKGTTTNRIIEELEKK